ncbi:hypothetical protein RT99_13290 [Flavobacterium sp. MEB061]|nr:hypothetical protein RT99_13290 [Flavobacterium sp. MEB061]
MSFRGTRNLRKKLDKDWRFSGWSYLRRFLVPRNDKTVELESINETDKKELLMKPKAIALIEVKILL